MSRPPVDVFACLADEQRLALLRLVAASDGLSASALAARVSISRQAVAKHLTTLARAGLVSSDRAGREVVFRVEPAPLRVASDWLQRSAAEWDRQLSLVKRAAEAGETDLAGGTPDR